MTGAPLQVPGIYRKRVGDIVVTALNDGYIDAAPEAILNIPAEDAKVLLAESFRPERPRITVNAFAIQNGNRLALVETGSGATLGKTLGRLQGNLAAAGIDAARIDTVLLTHMHPDHSNGLTDAEGRAAFPAAELRMHEDELAYWRDDDAAFAAANERRRFYFQTARAQLPVYRDRISLFRSGEVFPGVVAMPIPGHTPGHTAYVISSGGESLMIWGDIVHVPEVQIPRPEAGIAFDVDPAAAAAMRRRVLDMVSTDRVLVAGMHLHFPALAHVVRRAPTYALVPESWSPDA